MLLDYLREAFALIPPGLLVLGGFLRPLHGATFASYFPYQKLDSILDGDIYSGEYLELFRGEFIDARFPVLPMDFYLDSIAICPCNVRDE